MIHNGTTPEATANDNTDSASSLTLATYNIRYSDLDEGAKSWEKRREAVAATIRATSSDIVALQECWFEQLDDLGARLPTYEWIGYADKTGEHTPIGYDPNRVTVDSSGTFGLAPGGERGVIGWDALFPRTVTHATFRASDTEQQFAVFSVHFDNHGSQARAESANLITDRLPDCPVVVAGDLNCRPGSDPYRIITRHLTDTYAAAATRTGPEATYVGFDDAVDAESEPTGDKRIDYVLIQGFEVASYTTLTPPSDGEQPSDHLPVVTELTRPARDGVGSDGHRGRSE
jgi:endonuclease/exonuclease/phosphatase family metal-dependent hydrolase